VFSEKKKLVFLIEHGQFCENLEHIRFPLRRSSRSWNGKFPVFDGQITLFLLVGDVNSLIKITIWPNTHASVLILKSSLLMLKSAGISSRFLTGLATCQPKGPPGLFTERQERMDLRLGSVVGVLLVFGMPEIFGKFAKRSGNWKWSHAN